MHGGLLIGIAVVMAPGTAIADPGIASEPPAEPARDPGSPADPDRDQWAIDPSGDDLDPMPPMDCRLLEDTGRSPSVLRHAHWAIRGGSRRGRRAFAPSLGWSVWTRETLCLRRRFTETELVYSRVALAARVDYERDLVDAGDSTVRPALELSTGATDWGWIAITAAAGPKFDARGVAASGSVSVVYAGIDLEVRYDAGLDWDGYDISTFIGLSNLHLALPWLFREFRH